MTTLHDISLKVAQLVTDVLDGVATAGAATSLTDTNNLIQNNQYWDRGSLWIRSGNHTGKVLSVTGFISNKLNFATLGATPIAAGDRYSVARSAYPWNQIVSAIRQALDETHAEGDDNSHIGDGEILELVLPVGVWDVKRIEFERPGYQRRIPSHHYQIKDQTLRFDYGYAPCNGDIVHIIWRDTHPELTSYSTEISEEINLEWLKNKAAEVLLYWGAAQYSKNPEYMIEERMNRVMNNLKGKMPRYDGPDFEIHTAGG